MIIEPTELEIEKFGTSEQESNYIITDPEYVGEFMPRKDNLIEVIPAEEPKKIGWTIHETMGIGIINVGSLFRMTVGWPRFYGEMLKYGYEIVSCETNGDGTYIVQTKDKHGHRTTHILSPDEEVKQR